MIIELDGSPHGDYGQIVRDKIRDNRLEDLGLRILRFENRIVFEDPEFVLKEIREKFIKERDIESTTPV